MLRQKGVQPPSNVCNCDVTVMAVALHSSGEPENTKHGLLSFQFSLMR